MSDLEVKLTANARDALDEAANELDMDRHETFEYLVRNALRAYHVVEFAGHFILIDDVGHMHVLDFRRDAQGPTVFDRVIAKICRKPKEVTEWSERFPTSLDDKLVEEVEMQAKIFGFSPAVLYNRLVSFGCILAVHLGQEGHQVFAYGRDGSALGRIEFEAW